jgi:hypothetical protein
MRKFLTGFLPIFSLFLFFSVQVMYAQNARLGVQGILRKSNGAVLEDGNYDITFKLYNAEQGGTALWSEIQQDVEVNSGIYTVALGSVTSLSLPFNEDYYLGVKVGSTPEMSPRAKLTIAPYALSLKGNTNLFPSTGTVGGGTLTPNNNHLLHLSNSSGTADERLEGTTGAGLTFKRVSSEYSLGYTSADNKFRINSGTSNINIVHGATNRLTILPDSVSVIGSGTFLGNLTSSAGVSKLNNVQLNTSLGVSVLNNTAKTTFQRNGVTKFEINTDGIEVVGLLNLDGYKSLNSSFGFFNTSPSGQCVWTGTDSGSNNYSISANTRIRATEFNATSDRRIKKDITPADNLTDQQILRRLRVCDYRHIDEVSNGSASKKGFIAQEVWEVFPRAVSSSRGFIPSINDRPENYTVQDGQLLISMPFEHGLETGDVVRLMLPDGQQDLHVNAVKGSKSFILSGWTAGFPEWVFVFGKQVEDFLQVDYDQIHTLNVSATKELAKQVSTAGTDIKSVRVDVEGNTLKIDQLEARIRAMEAKVSN